MATLVQKCQMGMSTSYDIVSHDVMGWSYWSCWAELNRPMNSKS